jgi:hypothetical protein
MAYDSNSQAGNGRRTMAYAWRPVAMLVLVLAGLVYLLESDVLRAAIQSVLGSPLR